jgi:eukaryotic-like serine/threonine-protein kinase
MPDAPPSTASRSGSPRFGNYEILTLIGKGGMADVFKARAAVGPRAGQLVAIKRLLPALSKDPHYVDLFLAEADLSRLLHHPNIIETFDAGEINGTYYIAMEFIDGRDMGQVLARCRERNIMLPVDFALFLSSKILMALHYAHNAKSATGAPLNVVHCDVSPSNVFVSRVGEIRLGDFGIAKARVVGGGDENIRGKLYYLSPETLDGQVSIGTDLWAMTVTLYELLTSWKPFGGTSMEEVQTAIRSRSYKVLTEVRPEIPAALDEIIARGFAMDPAMRHQSALELAEDLAPHYDERVGTDLGIAAVVRGLFGT